MTPHFERQIFRVTSWKCLSFWFRGTNLCCILSDLSLIMVSGDKTLFFTHRNVPQSNPEGHFFTI